jgi:hypothetical protein
MTRVVDRREDEIVYFTCDACHKNLLLDEIETQESLFFQDTAGYGSKHIGDGTRWSITLCQDCIQSILGSYIQKQL